MYRLESSVTYQVIVLVWIPLTFVKYCDDIVHDNNANGNNDDLISFTIITIEWFSFECRKTKTKVNTLANHIGHRQYIEPIKTRSNYMWLTQSAGKCMRARHNWLWFYF